MKSLRFLLAVVFCGSLSPTLLADEPVFDAIDYASPTKYLVIADSLGDHDAIAKQASALKVADDRKTLANIILVETRSGVPIVDVAILQR